MKPHEQRVVQEHADLDAKIGKLLAFMDGQAFQELEPQQRGLLWQQLVAMKMYRSILAQRIALFPAE